MSKLKRLLKESEQWGIHNFRKIELSYVKGSDILAKPYVVNSYFEHKQNVETWINDLHLKRSGALIMSGEGRFFKDGHDDLFLVSIRVFKPHVQYWALAGPSEVRYLNEEKDFRWTALQEFVDLLRKDLAYGDSLSGWVRDLVLLLGDKAELEILIIMQGDLYCKKEIFEKMQRIRTVIDVRKRAGDIDRHFEFLMSKNVGFDKDRRIVDLIDDDEMFKKVCRCFDDKYDSKQGGLMM